MISDFLRAKKNFYKKSDFPQQCLKRTSKEIFCTIFLNLLLLIFLRNILYLTFLLHLLYLNCSRYQRNYLKEIYTITFFVI